MIATLSCSILQPISVLPINFAGLLVNSVLKTKAPFILL